MGWCRGLTAALKANACGQRGSICARSLFTRAVAYGAHKVREFIWLLKGVLPASYLPVHAVIFMSCFSPSQPTHSCWLVALGSALLYLPLFLSVLLLSTLFPLRWYMGIADVFLVLLYDWLRLSPPRPHKKGRCCVAWQTGGTSVHVCVSA